MTTALWVIAGVLLLIAGVHAFALWVYLSESRLGAPLTEEEARANVAPLSAVEFIWPDEENVEQ